MSTNLLLDQVAQGQAAPEVTVNNATAKLDAALTEQLAIDLTNNVALTAAQYRGNIYFNVTTTGATKTLTLQAIKRLVVIRNNGTLPFAIVVGSTSISLPNGFTAITMTDGTANGLTTTQVGSTLPAGGIGTAVAASNTLTAAGNFANGETVVVNGFAYTAQTSFTAGAGHFLIGAAAINSLTNLARCINQAGAGAGSLYDNVNTFKNNYISATEASPMVVTALRPGTRWNYITTTETATNLSWASATLTGGADKQVLRKATNTDYASEWGDWQDAPNGVPPGGAAGYSLQKNSSGDFDLIWKPTTSLPTGGGTNQVLTKQSAADFDYIWASAGAATNGLPIGGAAGDFIRKSSGTDFDAAWVKGTPNGGTTGQVLSKIDATDFNMQWATPAGGGLLTPVIPLVSDFATVVGTAITATDVASYGIDYHGTPAGTSGVADVRARFKALAGSGSTAFTAIMRIVTAVEQRNFYGAYMIMRESATGKMIAVGLDKGSGLALFKFTSNVLFSATYTNVAAGNVFLEMYFRIVYTGTTYAWSYSPDGTVWTFLFAATAKADFFTTQADQIGFGMQFQLQSGAANQIGMGITHFTMV